MPQNISGWLGASADHATAGRQVENFRSLQVESSLELKCSQKILQTFGVEKFSLHNLLGQVADGAIQCKAQILSVIIQPCGDVC